MSENNLDVREVKDFLALTEPMRWQVLFFGLISVKRKQQRIEKLTWGILGAVLLNVILQSLRLKLF